MSSYASTVFASLNLRYYANVHIQCQMKIFLNRIFQCSVLILGAKNEILQTKTTLELMIHM